MRYFITHIPRAGYQTPSGRSFQFETLNHSQGYLATEDPELVAELEKLAKAKKMGVQEITAQVYEADFAKKKLSSGAPPKQWREELAPNVYATDTISQPNPKTTSSSTPPEASAAPVVDSTPIVVPAVRTAKKSAVKRPSPPPP